MPTNWTNRKALTPTQPLIALLLIAALASIMQSEDDGYTLPVRDYDFKAIGDATDPMNSLLKSMENAGGFTATKLADAADLLKGMKLRVDSVDGDRSQVLNWLSFPACLMATGTRGFFVDAVKKRMFNLLVTTCGTLDHDLARTHRDYYHGDFELDDYELGEEGLARLGNVVVPNASYGEILEEIVQPVLIDIENERRESQRDSQNGIWHGFGGVELVWELGKRLGNESSLLYWAAKHKVPIVVPGIMDGSIGAQLFMHRQRSPSFNLDMMADQQRLSDLVWTTNESNALIVGGGISKHHVIWWNQYRGGLDNAVYLTTAPEHDGSLSGARLKEAVSWGKLAPEASHVTVEGDASVLLPLMGMALFSN